MRKFYSLVLIATALLIGTNAWAELHDAPQKASDEAKVQINDGTWQYASTLKEAFDAVEAGQTGNIELLKSISVGTPITMPGTIPTYANGKGRLHEVEGQNITLNLNGFNIEVPEDKFYVTPIRILKGSLVIEGSGTIHKPTTNTSTGEPDWYGGAIIAISGAQDKTASDWSVLTIGKDVTLLFDKEYDNNKVKKCKAIAITNFAGMGYTGTGKDAFCEQFGDATKGVDPKSASSQTDKYGYCTRATKKIWTNAPYGTKDAIPQKISENSESLPMECGALSKVSNTNDAILQGCAFGVKVTVKGTVKGSYYGVHFHGNINQTPECMEGTTTRKNLPAPYFTYQYPYVKVEKTATISAAEDGSCIGIYVAGYGVMDVEGSVSGATGIYMKSGDVVCKDANVWSTFTGEAKFNWGTNGDGGVHGAGGNAIVAETSDAYAGSMGVTLKGDTKVTGATGYAIFDQTTVSETVVDDVAKYTSTNHITIEGGTIAGGNLGTIAITQGAVNATSISGGNVEGTTVQISNPKTSATVTIPTTDFIPEGNHTTVVKDGNKDIVVVSKGGAPATKTTLVDIITAYTAWVNGGKLGEAPSVKATGTLGDLEQNLELKELEINETTSQTLTIKAGNTLTVGRVILGANAQIIVEPGAKFIVTGSDGIVAPKNTCIVLQTSGSKQAEFLFNPAVTSNRHPNATVEMKTTAGKLVANEVEYREWHRFAVPVESVVEFGKNPNWSTYLYAWDYSTDDWYKPSSPLTIMKPFEGYTLSPVSNYGEITYTFKGQLVGNDNHNLEFVKEGFNFFGNSYTAYMSVEQLIAQLTADGSNFEPTIWTWYSNHYHAVPLRALADNSSAFNDNQKQIKPMQTFILRLVDANEAETELNYKDAIWGNPRYASLIPNAAPARRAARNDNTFMRIILSAGEDNADDVMFMEQSKFSDAIDKGYDASKFMNEQGVNIFATVDGSNFSAVATDNVEGKMLSIRTANEATYSLSFSNVKGAEYAIRDNVTNQVIAIEEGASYEFAAQPNTTIEGRFEIISVKKVPTAIENTEVKANVKGIYTLMGQYLGEDFEALPAGVYVVNGVKIVK